jgi:hypothetical protein
VDDPAGQGFRGFLGIFTAHPNEREQASTHRADELTLHGDLRRTDTLNYRSHLQSVLVREASVVMALAFRAHQNQLA